METGSEITLFKNHDDYFERLQQLLNHPFEKWVIKYEDDLMTVLAIKEDFLGRHERE